MAYFSVVRKWGSLEGWELVGADVSDGLVGLSLGVLLLPGGDGLGALESVLVVLVLGLSLLVEGSKAAVHVLALGELHVVVDILDGEHVGSDSHALVSALDVTVEGVEVLEVVPVLTIIVAVHSPSVGL